METAPALEGAGRSVRVVSAPCLDPFDRQDQGYRDEILLPAVKARVAVEAASPLSWYRWVGDGGDVIGMTTFGASVLYKQVYEKFGITAEAVAERAKQLTS